MAIILSIETSTRVCSVAIHQEAVLLAHQSYHLEKSHSHLLPGIVEELLANADCAGRDVSAIAVSSGPGSYTGLRIGVSTAKGLAFGWGLPFIAVPTLEIMTEQVKPFFEEAYLCAMLDARRMEVYARLSLGPEEIWNTRALIVEADSFAGIQDGPIYLFGDGAEKTRGVIQQDNVHWIPNIYPDAGFMGRLAFEKFQNEEFEDLAYFEPQYLKPFQAKPSKKLI
jgi:tRNA threonylcarbamoyladenosine biosynthesis protein TsaB